MIKKNSLFKIWMTMFMLAIIGGVFTVFATQVFADTIPTTLSVTPYSIPYDGGSFSLTATMTPAVAGKMISFYLVDPATTGITTAYTNASGVAVVNGMNASGISVGDYPTGINASFAGDASYASATTTADLNITKVNQTIQFYTTLGDRTYGDADFSFGALSSSGLSVTFSASPSSVCNMVSSYVAHIVGVGSCTITANQAGDGNWNVAPAVSQTFNINPRPVTVSGSRPYDGTANIVAGILSIINKVGNDDVAVVSGSGTAYSANFFGGQSLISFGDLTLGGANANDYTLNGAISYINITPAVLTCQTGADTNSDGVISNLEILNYINSWKIGNVTSLLLLKAIGFWKIGTGC